VDSACGAPGEASWRRVLAIAGSCAALLLGLLVVGEAILMALSPSSEHHIGDVFFAIASCALLFAAGTTFSRTARAQKWLLVTAVVAVLAIFTTGFTHGHGAIVYGRPFADPTLDFLVRIFLCVLTGRLASPPKVDASCNCS
jgi:NhaP-type Na+/H+ or K+/H+ antiporter